MRELRFACRVICWLAPLAAFVLLAGCQKERFWKVGSEAPEISVLDLADKTVKLSEFRGKPVVLRFWATGCSACIAGMPLLDKMSRCYRDKGLVVLGVNIGNSKPLVEAFAKKLKLGYPVLLDPALIATKKYGVNEAPTTFFIDRDGIGRKMIKGEITREVFESTVKELM